MFRFIVLMMDTVRGYSKTTQPILGRWKPTDMKQNQIKSYLADIDNCGIYSYEPIEPKHKDK